MMSSQAKVIEKLKQSIHPQEKGSESKKEEGTDELLPYMMDYLTPAMVEEARTLLKETDDVRTLALEELRKYIEKEANLVTPTDDLFLLSFLRSRKFNVKKAFKLLQNYWCFRKDYRFIYDTSQKDSVARLILRNFLGMLPYRDRNGCVVLIMKIGNWNPDEDTYEDLFRAISAVLIHSNKFAATQVAGYRMIFDARHLTWAQLKYCTPANILLLVKSTQYCFPARYKGFHILSENKLFNLAWSIVRPLLTQKLKKRIILHGNDLSPLLDYIHPSVLPDEYGGEGGPLENSKWLDVIENEADNILGLLNYGYTGLNFRQSL
ncbi:clavesin-1-like [Uloborus diversus]|uniref:clavesin-1-like n=1 Tax=Uloborus diversus TaxID=327109 RepID=UPI0024096FB3|nr:clavesin-1-like [Uloborus diversus]XP_054718265.1 clavesin-1-like [Uloborus diversus]